MVPEIPPECNHPSPLLNTEFYRHSDLIFHLHSVAGNNQFYAIAISVVAIQSAEPSFAHVAADLYGDPYTYT
jgi:hypothetical protein